MPLTLVLIIVTGLIYRFFMNPIQKIKRVNDHNILQINIRGDLLDKLIFPMGKPNGLKFPLGNLAILKELRFKENILRCYAEIVIPGLDSTGNLHYEYRLCRITEINFLPLLQISPIKFADFQKFPESLDFYTKATNYYYHKDDFRLRRFAGVSFPQFSKELVEWDKIEANQFQRDRYITGKLAEKDYEHIDRFSLSGPAWKGSSPIDKIRHNIAQGQLSPLVREHFNLIKEKSHIILQCAEIKRLLKLINASEAHTSRRDMYEIAASQFNELHVQSEQLHQLYKRTISDILIGLELIAQDSNLLMDDRLFIQETYEIQFKRLKEESQYITDVSTAYSQLLNQ